MPVYQIPEELVFPDPELADEDGLLGIGGDLSPERLLLAYRNGIFPWYSRNNPIKWWSPDPRCVLLSERLKVKVAPPVVQAIKEGRCEVRFDTCFPEVIHNCAEVRRKGQRGTWITTEMIDAYLRLHKLGYAHSTEVFLDGELVGGLYGVSIGRTYSGESMFHLKTDMSKVALFYLVQRLKLLDITLIDCQVTNPHLLSLGAEEIARRTFLAHIRRNRDLPGETGKWTMVGGVPTAG